MLGLPRNVSHCSVICGERVEEWFYRNDEGLYAGPEMLSFTGRARSG